MFKNATLKLTLSYLAILMFLSLSFSVFIYKTTESELTAQVNQHVQDIIESSPNGVKPTAQYIEASKERLYNRLAQNKGRLVSSLALLNLIILVGSTGISYGLARFTLLPIENDRERQVRFTADASHELKTPLAAMKTQLEVALSTSTLDNPTRALLESNVEEIDKLTNLVYALMSLARSDYTTRELETLDVSDMLEDVVSRLLTVAEEKNILIDSSDIYYNETEPIKALGDKISISELFIILIENAIKYTPEKGCVTVRAFRGTGKTIVEVSDTGIGIGEKDLPHIFDRFYRAERSHNKTGTGGFGIGLSIAKSIAEGNMAKIDVESELGKGTTFRVQLKAR